MLNETKENFINQLLYLLKGPKIEGDSAYIKLINSTSLYYNSQYKELESIVQNQLNTNRFLTNFCISTLLPIFEEIFEEGGFVKINIINLPNDPKTRVNDIDSVLNARNFYYLIIDDQFSDVTIKLANTSFIFDLTYFREEKEQFKKRFTYILENIKQNQIKFTVKPSIRNRKTNFQVLLEEINAKGYPDITFEDLKEVIRVFENQRKSDYFLLKQPEQFLEKKFNELLLIHLLDERIDSNELLILKEFLKKIFKPIISVHKTISKMWITNDDPKFTNYVITLDQIIQCENGENLIKKILCHDSFENQIKEWENLGLIEKNLRSVDNIKKDYRMENYRFLPIDTKYFKDLEKNILNLFDDFKSHLNGLLIKSDNFHALQYLNEEYKGKVQTIYIDPPFNTGTNLNTKYVNNYINFSWITMIENRIEVAKSYLTNFGSFFFHIDFHSNHFTRLILDRIFKKENFQNELIARRTKGKRRMTGKSFSVGNESIFFYSKNKKSYFKQLKRDKKEKAYLEESLKKIKKIVPEIIPYEERFFSESVKEDISNDWTDIRSYSQTNFSGGKFPTERSESILERVIESTSREGDLIFDFFLGSGTTTAVAHKLNRKWIGVEMGNHFFTIILPRMKKVLVDSSYDRKDQNEEVARGFFSYTELVTFNECILNSISESKFY